MCFFSLNNTFILNLNNKHYGSFFFHFCFSRPIHRDTVHNRLRNVGLRCRRPNRGPFLTDRHKQARLRWARAHHRFTQRQWRMVLFTDESKFNVSEADGRRRVYRHQETSHSVGGLLYRSGITCRSNE